ncbi:MAG: DUF3343 domain-containing protein [Spirochaetales bacterium]|nr:DUF3343 domain-containing protein [Spirochaetales bacterium]
MKVFIFESTRTVIKAEQAVRDADIFCTVIPVPRSISPQCGMALEVDDGQEQTVIDLLTKMAIIINSFDRDSVKL